MKFSFAPHTIYFKRPFKISHGMRTSTPIVITQLECDGVIGYGEASLPPYLVETQESVFVFLNRASKLLALYKTPDKLEEIIKQVDLLAPFNTAAKASVDIALHDLYGKLHNIPCWKMFNADKNATPNTSFTFGIDTPEILKNKVEETREYKILKIKLNGEDDKLTINTIRSVTDKPIAIDLNQGWKNKFEALKMIEWLENKNVLFVEQPLPKENIEDAFWLFQNSPLPIFADEAIQRYSDIESIKHCYDGINIKLMKCGGMFEAHRMIERARELNLKILLGCMSETSCAISAAAQLSPLINYADLDGSLLIKNDLFDGVKFVNGKIMLDDLPGIGAFQKV
jgi:L-alanine-DL-glutamate epimerase-like enolase superfamily enzyme